VRDYDPALIDKALALQADKAGPLLPVLHEIQDRLGYIPASAVPQIAKALTLSSAEVHGVITYYHHFRSQPAHGSVIQVCRAEACQARGGEALAAHIEKSVQGKQVEVEPVYCLGLCASGPSLQINERLHGRMTAEKFDRLLVSVLEALS
jgi:formate dehydrogenase subunit gamma